MFITAAIGLLVVGQAQKIDYKIEVRNDRGVMASPHLMVLDKQTGEILVKKMPWEFFIRVTPDTTIGDITNTVSIQMTEAEKRMKKKPYSTRTTQATYITKSGQTVYFLLTPDRQGVMQENGEITVPVSRGLMKGEILVTVAASIGR